MYRFKSISRVGFFLPSLLGTCVFYLIPFIYIFGISVSSLDNMKMYSEVLNNHAFKLASLNTIIFMLLSVPLLIVLAMVLTLFISDVSGGNRLISYLTVPMVIPIASTVLFFEIIFDYNGVINYIIVLFGYNKIDWLNTGYSRIVILIMYLWKNIGYSTIVYLAAHNSIPNEYYEIAELEGANRLQKFVKVTFIYLLPATFYNVTYSIICSFKVFKEIYLLTGAYPNEKLYMIQHYLNNLFGKMEFNQMITSSIIITSAILVIIITIYKVQKRVLDSMYS